MDTLRQPRPALVAVLLLAIAIGGAFYWYTGRIPDYVILDVPYLGLYSGTILWNDSQTSAAMLLRYWGDGRVDLKTITKELPTGTLTSFDSLSEFFRRYGYRAEVHEFRGIKELSKFINPQVKTPLIMLRRLSHRTDLPPIYTFSVLLGIRGSREELIFHDNIYGNNYRITFSEFEDLLQGVGRKFLAVQPTPEIKNQLRPVWEDKPYPLRRNIMDSADNIDLNLRWAVLDTLASRGDLSAEQLRDGWQAIVEHPAFLNLHPLGRIVAYIRLAKYHRDLKNYTEAIRVIEEYALRLNHNLNQPYGEWDRDPTTVRESIQPWLSLERTYIAMGDLMKAKAALGKALALMPDDPTVREDLRRLNELTNEKGR